MSGRPPIAPKRGVSVGHGASVGGSTKANSRRPPRSSDVEMSSFMNKSATGGVFSSLPLSGSQSTRLSASSISSAILAGVFTITLVVILLVLQRVNTMQLPTSSSAGGGRIRDGERGLTSSPRDLAERKTDGKSTDSGSKGRDDGEQQAGGNKKAVEKAKEKPQANSNNDGKGDSRDGFPASSSSSSFFSSDDNENDNADDTLEGIDADSIAMGADRGKLEDTSVSSSDAQTKPSATKTDNRAPDKKKVKKVWCKGSWVRFGLNNNNNNGGAESSGSSGNAEGGGGGNGGNKNTAVFENGVPRGLCTPFPSVSGLAASCNLQPLLTSLQEQQQQKQGGESADGQAGKGSGVSPPPPEKGAAINALLQFQIDVVEGLTVHEVKCTAGCTKATFSVSSSSSAGEAVDGSAAAATEASGSVTKPTLSPFKFTKGIVSIASVGDLTGRCGPDSDNNEKQQGDGACIIAFDLLVSYNSEDQMRSNGEGRESVSRRGASTKGAADDSNFPPMCFLSVGDWGSQAVKPVADQMAIDAERYFAKFIISTGDNFYPVGVKSITDPHWENSFEKPFSSPFLKFVRWYISAGNHDQWGLGPQLEYGKTHPRWYFPSPFYNDEVPIHEDFSLPTADDASVSKGNAVGVVEGQGCGSNVEAPPALISSSSSSSQQLVPASSTSIFLTVLDYNGRNKNHQIAFLDAVHRDKYKELSGLSSIDNRNVPLNPPPSSDPSKVEAEGGQRDVVVAGAGAAVAHQQRKKYMWKGIVNHPLLFGGSSHGLHVETVHNRAQLKPTIDKHNVHWHLSGHDHILEILKSDKTDYLISGAGGGSKMYTSSKVAETIWWQGEGVTMRGFMRHCVYGHEKMTTTVIDDKGVEHYTHTTLYDN